MCCGLVIIGGTQRDTRRYGAGGAEVEKRQARKVLDSDVGAEIAKVFEEHGVKHLAYSASGFRVISSNKKIEKPEDYGGLRMRVPNVAMFLEMAGLLGVNGQAMAFTEVFTALEQGVVDAQENPMSLIKAQGFYEVQKKNN